MPENLLDRVDAALDHASALDRYLRRIHTDDHTEPHSDRNSTGHMKRLAMDQPIKILYGKVVDSIAYCHWYKVQPEGAKATIPCCMLSGSALTPFGVREHNQLHPNAGVYILLHPGSPYGVILGIEPAYQSDGTKSLSDYISLCSAHSMQTEQVHNFPFTLAKNGSIVDWSSGRPADGTCAGEWGMLAESGVGVFVDSAMAFLRADENCGLWAFYRDQLARLCGHNMQIRAGGWEVEALDDQGEFSHTEGFTPYPWEQLGVFEFGTDPRVEKTPTQRQISEPHYSKYEPVEDDQQPFHRTRHYNGYAGQGGKRIVNAPPKGATGVNRYGDEAAYVGLFEEQVSQAGMWTVRSAKGVRFMKRTLIPVPKAMKRPEDATGDNETNYRAASRQGAGVDHAVTGDITASGPDPHMNRALGVMDAQTYAVNWEGVIGFKYHEKDYYLPEEETLKESVGVSNITEIPFSQLRNSNFLPMPTPGEVTVDHRYQAVKYYPSHSYFELMDDGGVLMGDGYGSEIRMVGGNIYITCPGDLFLQPGRRLVGMAKDVFVRAENGLELSTTERDVRIHSGRNMEVAAEGGVLVESKSLTSDWTGWRDSVGEDVRQSGINLKAANSCVATWADMIYMRTGVDSVGTGIVIDAGQGEGNVSINCSNYQLWASSGVGNYVGEAYTPFVFSSDGALIGGSLSLKGTLVTSGSILTDGSLIASGHVVTALAEQYSGQVAPLKDQGLAEADEGIAANADLQETTKTAAGTSYESLWENGFYQSGQCGDNQTIQDIRFSFRTGAQYNSDDFRLYEARWQQLARLWETSSSYWSEKPVSKSGEDTYPFPGKEKLVEEPSFYTQDLSLFDLDAGTAKARSDSAYSNPQYASPQPVMLNEQYRING